MSEEIDSIEIFRVYQRVRRWQRVIVMIPASVSIWVDTCLHPCIIGTRSLLTLWRARVAYNSQQESADTFRQRMNDIRIRFIPDESVIVDQRVYIVLDNDLPIIPTYEEVLLQSTKETMLRFPMERGRIQVRCMGAKPTDKGIIRIDFITQLAAADDNIMFPNSAASVEFYPIDTEEFPEPLEPNPFAKWKPE